MSEIEELQRCLEALEARVDEVEMIRTLRDTQLEHGKLLETHGKALEAHTKTLQEHGKLLGALVSGQVAMMEQLQAVTDHLGVTPPEQPGEEN
ncbi:MULTISPECIES: hypothetical protein [Streptomyces]|uniref:Uncharacterized protein n=1 Tax=Streptomyces canarius TaxID=285453 RepID=A0ABQ3CET3_9ACTN|nr:hypothetical protein [Streptomyces canarius]GHA08429.1 hypothetical protein GCM10010345_10970 [Streptomyces canarius]